MPCRKLGNHDSLTFSSDTRHHFPPMAVVQPMAVQCTCSFGATRVGGWVECSNLKEVRTSKKRRRGPSLLEGMSPDPDFQLARGVRKAAKD